MNTFTTRFYDIEGRWDPQFYNPSLHFSNNAIYPKTRLGKIIESVIHPPEYERVYSDSGIQLLRAQNVRPTGIELNSNQVFFSKGFLESKKYITPEIGDVLIVRSGVNAGDTATIEEKIPFVILGADNLVLKCTTQVIPKFIQAFFFTDFGRREMNRHLTGATNKHINADNVCLIKVLLPPKEIQSKIVNLFENALKRKSKREIEAKELLASIDYLLLSELGISLPKENDNQLIKRIFIRKFSVVSGGRFDPSAYKSKISNIQKSIKKSKYAVKKLKDLVFPAGQIVTSINESDLYVGLENVDGLNAEVVPSSEKETISTALKFKEGHILFPKLRPYLNKTTITNFNGLCSTEFHVFKAKNINPEYLCSFLRSKATVKITSALMTGNTLPRIQMSDIMNLEVPIPDAEKQYGIVQKILEIKTKAKQLIEQAREELECTKKEIETMLIGS